MASEWYDVGGAFEEDLRTKGYAIVPGVLTPGEVGVAKQSFYGWVDKIPGIKERHRAMDPHGIFRHYEVSCFPKIVSKTKSYAKEKRIGIASGNAVCV